MTTTTAPPAPEDFPDAPRPAPAPYAVPALDVVVPVHNEEVDLAASVRRLHAHLTTGFPYRFRITVADNASTDGTLAVAERLAAELPEVRAVHLPEKGRGRALRAVWSTSDAPVLAYTDVDLSTDLAALAPLVALRGAARLSRALLAGRLPVGRLRGSSSPPWSRPTWPPPCCASCSCGPGCSVPRPPPRADPRR
jgi:hypothetical protein